MEATTMQPQDATRGEHAGLLEEITRSVVRLHKEYIGHGPTKARTYISDDVVVCVLRGALTKVERRLVDLGQTGAVIQQRLAIDEALRQPLSDTIERLLKRRVVGFTSAIQPAGELSTLVFLLAPSLLAVA